MVSLPRRGLVNEILRRGNRTPIEGGDPAHERVDDRARWRAGKLLAQGVTVVFRRNKQREDQALLALGDRDRDDASCRSVQGFNRERDSLAAADA